MALGVSFSLLLDDEPERRFIILSNLQVHSGMLGRGEEKKGKKNVCK